MSNPKLTRLAAMVLTAAAVVVPVRAGGDVVAEASHLQFHSDVLLNLHHTLYGAAWARPQRTCGSLRFDQLSRRVDRIRHAFQRPIMSEREYDDHRDETGRRER